MSSMSRRTVLAGILSAATVSLMHAFNEPDTSPEGAGPSNPADLYDPEPEPVMADKDVRLPGLPGDQPDAQTILDRIENAHNMDEFGFSTPPQAQKPPPDSTPVPEPMYRGPSRFEPGESASMRDSASRGGEWQGPTLPENWKHAAAAPSYAPLPETDVPIPTPRYKIQRPPVRRDEAPVAAPRRDTETAATARPPRRTRNARPAEKPRQETRRQDDENKPRLSLPGLIFGRRSGLVVNLHNVHTGESLKFDAGNFRSQKAQINRICRDWRRNEQIDISNALIARFGDVAAELGVRNYSLICGYRSPATNRMLQRTRGGQASNSLHLVGKAFDIASAQASIREIRDAAVTVARKKGSGGVGYYPGSGFVHFDIGRLRQW